VIGLGLPTRCKHAAPGCRRSAIPNWAARYRHHYFARQHELSAVPGTLEMLHAAARHHWLAVATGKSRRGLDDALAIASWQGLFDATRTADETASKPHPKMLLELMRELRRADPSAR
jgi:phosphoglycolate phosphatase